MSEAIVEAQDLTKKYNGNVVVDHLNLRLNERDTFGLLGHNGAGKTTTILMLLGLTEPASGTVRVCGFDPVREPLKVKRLVGYMPERVGLYEDLTARENLQFVARLNNITDAESQPRINDLLKMVGLSKVADEKASKFSRGMKQRLGIADALVKEPKLVILDEPTAGLDPEGISHILDFISKLPEKGTSVIMSSHRLHEVQKTCNRVGIMSAGKLMAEGSLDELGKKAMTGGRYMIEVETGETSPQLKEVIEKIKGVTKVEVNNNSLLVTASSDLRATIAKAVVQNNVPLIQMKIQEFDLDDVYMKYFREEK